MHSYDVENDAIGLTELAEESDVEPGPTYKRGEEVQRTAQLPKKHDDL